MAQIFRTMFDEGLREWDVGPDYNTRLLSATWGSHQSVDLSRTTFADDCAKTMVCTSLAQLEGTVDRSDVKLDRMLGERGMAQNKGKKEVMFCFMGTGSAKESQYVWANWDDQRGKLKERARYLGAIRRWDGKEVDNVKFRCDAALGKFYEFGGLWKSRDVDIGVKRIVFHSVLKSTLLTGLEAAVLTDKEEERIN